MKKSNLSTLDQLDIGEKALIIDITSNDKKLLFRLFDLGFVYGAKIQVLYKSMFGNTIAYFIKGTKIALRSEDANNILVDMRR